MFTFYRKRGREREREIRNNEQKRLMGKFNRKKRREEEEEGENDNAKTTKENPA